MQDRPSSSSPSSSSWPLPNPVSPLRSLADMQSSYLASSDCIEEMSYSGIGGMGGGGIGRGGGGGEEDNSRDILRSEVSEFLHTA